MSAPARKQAPRSRGRALRESGTLPCVERPPSAVVIDDHRDLREAIAEILERAGWSVRAFGSVDEALPDVRARLPDVVLTDINVGALSGAALARELRLDPSTKGLTIVAMSGTTIPTERMLALFDAFLPKPIDVVTLPDVLRRTFEDRRRR